MATNVSKSDSVCIVCFKSKDVEVFNSCNHSVCIGCINERFEKSEDGDEFRCPICLMEGPNLPEEEPKDLENHVQHNGFVERGKIPRPRRDLTRNTNLCAPCCIEGVEILGVVLCPACGLLYMCQECADRHAAVEANKEHVIVPLTFQNKEDKKTCTIHRLPLTRHCQTCVAPICSICVLKDHQEHSVESLAVVIEMQLTDVKQVLGNLEAELEKFKQGREDLLQLIALAKDGDRGAIIYEAMEEHAGKVIDIVQEWKAATKKDLDEKFGVIPELDTPLADYTKAVLDLEAPTIAAKGTVSKAELNPKYLEELMELMDDLQGRLASLTKKADIPGYSKRVQSLLDDDYVFVPKPVTDFGSIAKFPQTFQPQQLAEYPIQDCPDGAIIRHISMISVQLYAVALSHDNKTYFIHVYETSSNALKDKFFVDNMSCMAATPDGSLAIISKEVDAGYRINVHNLETGETRKAINLEFTMEPRDITVNSSGQFIVLCTDGMSQGEIILVGEVEGVLTTYTITPADLVYSNKIACGGKYVFISGANGKVGIYELALRSIKYVTTYNPGYAIYDITGKSNGDFFMACNVYLWKYKKSVGSPQWGPLNWNHQGVAKSTQLTISTRDGHKVLVGDHTTIRLFKTF